MKANCTEEIAQRKLHRVDPTKPIAQIKLQKKTIAHIKIAGSKLHKENI